MNENDAVQREAGEHGGHSRGGVLVSVGLPVNCRRLQPCRMTNMFQSNSATNFRDYGKQNLCVG